MSVYEGWWGSSENLIRSFVFVPGFTQGNKDAGSYNSFPCFHSFRNPPPLQKLWKESSKSTPTRILRTWTLVTSTQDTSPTPAPPHPKNHWLHSPSSPSTRSSFLDNIQLYTKTAPKRRIPLQNHKLSFHHNHHNTHDHHLSCHFHLPHQHSNDQLNKYTRLHSLSLPYFQ